MSVSLQLPESAIVTEPGRIPSDDEIQAALRKNLGDMEGFEGRVAPITAAIDRARGSAALGVALIALIAVRDEDSGEAASATVMLMSTDFSEVLAATPGGGSESGLAEELAADDYVESSDGRILQLVQLPAGEGVRAAAFWSSDGTEPADELSVTYYVPVVGTQQALALHCRTRSVDHQAAMRKMFDRIAESLELNYGPENPDTHGV